MIDKNKRKEKCLEKLNQMKLKNQEKENLC